MSEQSLRTVKISQMMNAELLSRLLKKMQLNLESIFLVWMTPAKELRTWSGRNRDCRYLGY